VSTPGFCPQCGVAALQEAIRCTGCEWMLPAGDDPHSARGLARALSAALGDGYAVIEEMAAQRSPQLAERGASHATPVKDHS
jgi:hypothetical protein